MRTDSKTYHFNLYHYGVWHGHWILNIQQKLWHLTTEQPLIPSPIGYMLIHALFPTLWRGNRKKETEWGRKRMKRERARGGSKRELQCGCWLSEPPARHTGVDGEEEDEGWLRWWCRNRRHKHTLVCRHKQPAKAFCFVKGFCCFGLEKMVNAGHFFISIFQLEIHKKKLMLYLYLIYNLMDIRWKS